jgi:hypothetical protein
MKNNVLLSGAVALALTAGTILLPSFAAAATNRQEGGPHGRGHSGAMHAGISQHNVGNYHGSYGHGGGYHSGGYYSAGNYGGGYYGPRYYGGYYGGCGPIPNVLGFCAPLPFGL